MFQVIHIASLSEYPYVQCSQLQVAMQPVRKLSVVMAAFTMNTLRLVTLWNVYCFVILGLEGHNQWSGY